MFSYVLSIVAMLHSLSRFNKLLKLQHKAYSLWVPLHKLSLADWCNQDVASSIVTIISCRLSTFCSTQVNPPASPVLVVVLYLFFKLQHSWHQYLVGTVFILITLYLDSSIVIILTYCLLYGTPSSDLADLSVAWFQEQKVMETSSPKISPN